LARGGLVQRLDDELIQADRVPPPGVAHWVAIVSTWAALVARATGIATWLVFELLAAMFVVSIVAHCTFDDALGACVAWNIHCIASCPLVWPGPGPPAGLPTRPMTADPKESLTARIGTVVPVVS
jgi:hypothetical protein